MTDDSLLTVIRQNVDATAALRSVASLADQGTATVERKMYYPYYRFSANCTVPTLFGRQAMTVNCLVDGVNGLGATAACFSTETVSVAADSILQLAVTERDAESAARRTISHQLGRKLRMIASFQVEIDAHSTVYKGFWIVRAQDTLIMLDAATGCSHPLSLRAA